MMYGRARWQEAEATRKDFSTVLIRQDKKFFTSELFKVIQDAIPLMLHCRTMCWFRASSSSTFVTLDVQSIYTPSQIQDWYREDKFFSRERQMVFFAAVNPMHKNHQAPKELDLTKPRHASYKQKWKNAPGYGVLSRFSVCSTERIEVLSNKIERNHRLRYTLSLLYLESNCDEIWRNHIPESLCVHLDHRRNFPTKIIGCVTWILMSLEAAKKLKRIQPKPNTQLSSAVRPGCGPESTKRCVLTPKHDQEDQTGTGWPVLLDWKEDHEIDFRVPGLSHAVVKEAEHLRVQELVKKIENHPHREALQYNPFRKKSKAMIRELGNVDLFESCETIPKVQCSHCLLYRNQGIVYCTCGQCLIDSESRRKFDKLRLDALSVPNYVIKNGPTHGAWHGKTEEQKEYHIAWNAWKGCCKKVDSQGEHVTGVHDRFLRDPIYRESQLAIGGQNKSSKNGMNLHKKTIHKVSLQRTRKDTKNNGILLWTKQAKMGLLKLRSDCRAAVLMKYRFHHESGEPNEEPIHPDLYRRWHPSSSTSWWDKSEWNWTWAY